MIRLLNAGFGGVPLWNVFKDCKETTLDIDPVYHPDILASMTDLGNIGPYEIVFCSHALEHLYKHQVEIALREFYRVLSPGGYVAICVPDLEDIKLTEDALYESESGPVSGMDMYYGHHVGVEQSPYMAHHTGFTRGILEKALLADFKEVQVLREYPSVVGYGRKI